MESRKMAHKKSAEIADSIFQTRLRKGGQRMRLTGRADLYERNGANLKQLNEMGSQVRTRALLSNRLRINDFLRAVGNVYGASVEEVRIGLSGEFLPEAVDGGQCASGGPTPHLVAVGQRVRIAEAALAELPSLRHRLKTGDGVGPPSPLPLRSLVDAVCVSGSDLNEVALKFGWYVRRPQKNGSLKTTIPKQQSQKLKAGLIEGLEAIETAWSEANIDISRLAGRLEVG
jgi:hypothetical protein